MNDIPDESDQFIVELHFAGGSSVATIDLESGHCHGSSANYTDRDGERTWTRHNGEMVFDADELTRIEKAAREIHARGEYEYRDQFAQATVTLTVIFDRQRVVATYHVDGGIPTYEELHLFVLRRLRAEMTPDRT